MSHKCLPVIQDPSSSEPEDHDGLPRYAMPVSFIDLSIIGSIPLGRRASIGALSNGVLFVVFGFYRISTSWDWHRLAHDGGSSYLRHHAVWIFNSTNTCCWPALPIAIRCRRSHHGKHNGYEGCEHLSPEDGDNIVAALQHGHNRVRSIKLCLTNSLVGKLSTQVKEPFSELEDLVLRSISSRSSAPHRLYPQLRLHQWRSRMHWRRIVLPALTRLEFRGFSEYLECLVAEIDAPCLAKIEITFVGHVSSLSEIGQFINLIEAQRLHRRAVIQTSVNYISIRFTPSGVESPSYFVLGMYHTRLDRQLSSMARVLRRASQTKWTVDGEGWLRLLRQFGGAESFYVAGELATDIMHALLRADGEFATVLPALRELDAARGLSRFVRHCKQL
ncbi:hypothetical protein EDB92DRAFT_1818935 [Lactarius akahatsu]|uniref:Uncharacterized protein n=1 Tax=Lactarius akahatsu TaxID=416441 RepID=A0AAD4QA54_9AGAM|nr:hypothetical protein EDB92DRAFT_1818935 [Lactarius akahatsu]